MRKIRFGVSITSWLMLCVGLENMYNYALYDLYFGALKLGSLALHSSTPLKLQFLQYRTDLLYCKTLRSWSDVKGTSVCYTWPARDVSMSHISVRRGEEK
jgi:hypothetical protein